MARTAVIVVFTARPVAEILEQGGSRDWRLDPSRARQAEYLICTHNSHNPAFRAATAPHRAATLIGRIAGVVPSPDQPGRWLIKISEFITPTPPISNIWGKSGHLRYPVWYTTLEELDIDLEALPPFKPIPPPGVAGGLSERSAAPVLAPVNWMQTSAYVGHPGEVRPMRPPTAGGQDAWRRLDAILDQIDRIQDLPVPFDPLDWDAHGLPR